MSRRNIFGSDSVDGNFVANSLGLITPKNCTGVLHDISDLLNTSDQIERANVLPALAKIEELLKENQNETAATLLSVFAHNSRSFFEPQDLHKLFELLIENSSLFTPSCISNLFILATKALEITPSLVLLIDSPLDLVPFFDSFDRETAKFVFKIAKLEPSTRVPLVFGGLLEKLLPFITTDELQMELLGILVQNSQVRKYVIDMDHVPTIFSGVMEVKCTTCATNTFIFLLNRSDLTSFVAIQGILGEIGAVELFQNIVFDENSSDETIGNALLCLAECVRYHQIENIYHQRLIDVIGNHQNCIPHLLFFLESLSTGSPRIFDEIKLNDTLLAHSAFNPFFSYLLYETTHKKMTVVGDLGLELVYAIQTRQLHPNAGILSQERNDLDLQGLASMNCLVCHTYPIPICALIQSSIEFMERNRLSTLTPPFSYPFYPQSFLDWVSANFCTSTRHQWLSIDQNTVRLDRTIIFTKTPMDCHKETLAISQEAQRVNDEYQLLIAQIEAAQKEISKLQEENRGFTIKLTDARMRQVKESLRSV